MQLKKVEHYYSVVVYRYLFVKKKVFNLSELHFSEVTSYKIHTLEVRYQNMPFFFNSSLLTLLQHISAAKDTIWLDASKVFKIITR